MASKAVQGPDLNQYDVIGNNKYNLSDPNTLRDNLILIYIYVLPDMPGHGFKVGMTKCKLNETFWHAIDERVSRQTSELVLSDSDYEKYGQKREVVFWGISLKDNHDDFKDHVLHKRIANLIPGYLDEKDHEWFRGSNLTLDKITDLFFTYRSSEEPPYEIFKPRDPQKQAIEKITEYFSANPVDRRFLLNCKMRFGKCYTVYKYAEQDKTKKRKILILTFVPAVEEEWHKNLRHISTYYDYYTDDDLKENDFKLEDDPETPYVVFLSLQNYLGKDSGGVNTKKKIKKLEGIHFDLLILDEYHFGAWNNRTSETIEDLDIGYQKELAAQNGRYDFEKRFKISVDQTLCLSGTPFKAIDSGDFTEANTFTYSYFDEQKNKYPNSDDGDFNAVKSEYAEFPDMKIYGYNMASLFDSNLPFLNDLMRDENSINANHKLFSLNKFFETEKDSNPENECVFVYEEQILMWLDIIRGIRPEDGLNFPYAYTNYKYVENSLWLLPTVNSCIAMADLLKKHDYFKQYEIINLSDPSVGAGMAALEELQRGLTRAKQSSKLGTISLTVNKLTLGITVEEWSSVFVLKDLSSPEQYFQSIFRIQTPQKVDGIIKKDICKVYDFNIDRAASLLLKYADNFSDPYSTKLQMSDLIVKYMPIYLNGDMNYPIGKDVFYELAEFGDTTRQPLSKKICNTARTTHADGQTLVDMLGDEECLQVMNKVFAHVNFNKKTKGKGTRPLGDESKRETHKKSEYKKGLDIGYTEGITRYLDFANLDKCQDKFVECCEFLYQHSVPPEYDEKQKKWFHDGISDGYKKGIMMPIKKMQCGAEDGTKFISDIKKQLGLDIRYSDTTKGKINDIVNKYLGNIDNIPLEYRGQLYQTCYKESFKNAVKQGLTDPNEVKNEKTVEDIDNVLKHILARLFQFLYISVYRETTFNEIFENADPDVFLSAVGITKTEFEILNKYHIFQENVLDRYIHEFFVNETLGKSLTNEEQSTNYYRNSFNWFGYGVEN